MLTDVSLKVEIVKNNNKFHEKFFRTKMVRHAFKIIEHTANDLESNNKS